MELYKSAIRYLREHATNQTWAEFNIALDRATNKAPVAWDFSTKACEAMGVEPQRALPAVAALTCAHMGLMLIDDLLDEDPRGEYLRIGAGRAANLAAALNALGTTILLDATECRQNARAAKALNEMITKTAYGQDLDVQNASTEEGYWEVTRAKSGPYFGTAFYIGALFGDASLRVADQLKTFGELFGEIMQIHDDLNDCLANPANADWLQGRNPLPILFAELVEHPDRPRFIELRSQVQEPDALQEAQSILVRSGAISYCVSELLTRQKTAYGLLEDIELNDTRPLQVLLEQAIAPVKHLFTSVGAEFSEAEL